MPDPSLKDILSKILTRTTPAGGADAQASTSQSGQAAPAAQPQPPVDPEKFKQFQKGFNKSLGGG